MKRFVKLALAVLLAFLFLSQGMHAPFEKDEETRPAGIIVEMVRGGSWIVPLDLYAQVTRKPPLYYWLSALVAKARGGTVDEAGARVVSISSAAAVAGIVWSMGATYLQSEAGGWLAVLFLLGTYGFAARAAYARTDMLFTGLLFGAYCGVYPLIEGEKSAFRAIVAGVLLGLATLTKGPLAPMVCGFAVVLYVLASGRNPLTLLSNAWPWIVTIVATLVALTWYVPAFLLNRELLAVQLVQENAGHFLPLWLGGTGEAARPLFYLWIRLLGVAQPLILYFPAAFALALGARRTGGVIVFQMALVLTVLGVFTVASSKRDEYILPALPALAIVLAAPSAVVHLRAEQIGTRWSAGFAKFASAVASCAMLALGLIGLTLAGRPSLINSIASRMQSSDAAYAKLFVQDLTQGHLSIVLIMLVISASSVAALFLLRRHQLFWAAAGVGGASLAAVSLWIGILRPELTQQRTLREFVKRVQEITDHRTVELFGSRDYEVAYYFGQGVQTWPAGGSIRTELGCTSYLLVWSSQLDRLAAAGVAVHPPLLESYHETSSGRLLLLNLDDTASHPFTSCPPA